MLKGYGANLGWKAIWLSGRESGVWGGVSGRSIASVAGLWNTHLSTTADGEHAALARAAFCAAAQQRRARDALLVRQLRDASSAARAVACEQMMAKSEAALEDAAEEAVAVRSALVPMWRTAPPLAGAFLAKTFWHSISDGAPAPMSVSRHWRDADAVRAVLLGSGHAHYHDRGQQLRLTHRGEAAAGGGHKKRRRERYFEEEAEAEADEAEAEAEEGGRAAASSCSAVSSQHFFEQGSEDEEEEEEDQEEAAGVVHRQGAGVLVCDDEDAEEEEEEEEEKEGEEEEVERWRGSGGVARKQRRVDFSPQDDCDLLRALRVAQHDPRRPMWRRVLQHAHERGQLLSVADEQACRKRAELLFAQGRPCLAVF